MMDDDAAAVEVLRTLVAFDTTSSNSNLALAEWVAARAADCGASASFTYNGDRTKANLLVTLGPADVPGIVLSGHTDVVPVAGQAWTSDPFELREEGGRLYGRGASDMKGFIACCVAALPHWARMKLDRPIHLALSFDEEVGCLGVPLLIEGMLAHAARPLFAIVGEPTDMRLATAHKGFCLYSTSFNGREAHSSLPHLGRSAISAAVRFANYLLETGSLLSYRSSRIPGLEPAFTTFNIGQIEGGTAINIIARRCSLKWEFRPVPDEDVAAIKARVGSYLEAMRATAEEDGWVEHHEVLSIPPLNTDPAHASAVWLREFLGMQEPIAVPFGTEAGFFSREGIPALVCGPGSIEQAHRADEFIEGSQLAKCMRLMAHVGAFAAAPVQYAGEAKTA